MRTTIDIPEDLVRRAKATAALRGITMKHLIAELLQSALSRSERSIERGNGMNCPIPVTVPASVLKLKPLSSAEIDAILTQEDLEKIELA